MRPTRPTRLIRLGFLLAAACTAKPSGDLSTGDETRADAHRLPTGVYLDPAGRTSELGSFPLALVPVPGDGHLLVLLNGHREQGIQVVDGATGRIDQTLPLAATFIGIAFDSAAHRFYLSGGNSDVVYRYDWNGTQAALSDSFVLAPRKKGDDGTRYPAGLALSPDGRSLYVAENLADSLAVIDVASGKVVQRLAAGRYPYGVAVSSDGSIFVSAWGGYEVRAYAAHDGRLTSRRTIPVGRHPSTVLLNRDGSRLFVTSASTDRIAVVDTRRDTVLKQLADTVPAGPGEGSTPNALALSADGRRLFVAEADNNAVAVFELSAEVSGAAGATGTDQVIGRIPVEWYPTALAVRSDSLFVVNGKGKGTAPNPGGPNPGKRGTDPRGYSLDQTTGSLSVVPLGGMTPSTLAQLSTRVAHANGWDLKQSSGSWPPFEHVIYVIKENRTYDQVLGDLPKADGDTALTFFPRSVTPNHHALAERFGTFDRFFVNAEVSADGHNWSMGAYVTDYTEKTLPQVYSGRGRSYDFEGTNRDKRVDDDAAEPAMGYLWDLAQRKKLSFRNFGEFVLEEGHREGPVPQWYKGLKPFLEANTDSGFPGFDLDTRDQVRADIWIAQLHEWEKSGTMPALQILRLPNDHTSGASGGKPTPRAYLADNDLALGRVVEALSKSRYWTNTVMFVLEDDAQDGPDHVDSHRSPFLLISAYNRPHVWHRWTNTTDVLATIESMLSLDHLSQFDAYARPLRGVFASSPDTVTYHSLVPSISLDEKNPPRGRGAKESEKFDFRIEDLADDEEFNRVLWVAIKGDVPYPGPTRMTAAGAIGR
ncbi:MAG TPA: bifunctional YncE family protein/alkaline phosphatase family protein [Gemmatimonadales bacterium]|nr:bifunctional YncE family protein/alkaline phosphatase family protein [Gemmatimonadales bacterium]